MPLQITINFDYIYSFFYFGFLIFTSIFKSKNFVFSVILLGNGGLMYPPSIWELEFASIFFFFLLQIYRLNMGYHANRTEHTMSMILFLVFTLFSTLFCVYFSFLTTYVLLIEIAVGVIAIFFGAIEIIMALIAVIKFKGAHSN